MFLSSSSSFQRQQFLVVFLLRRRIIDGGTIISLFETASTRGVVAVHLMVIQTKQPRPFYVPGKFRGDGIGNSADADAGLCYYTSHCCHFPRPQRLVKDYDGETFSLRAKKNSDADDAAGVEFLL
jgi:hypothetical protein